MLIAGKIVVVCGMMAMCLAAIGCGSGPESDIQSRLDALVSPLIEQGTIHGLAVASIEGGHIEFVKTYGWRNVENQLPLTESSVMYGASFTKTAVAYMVLQLVDEGLLNLDDTIQDLLPEPLPSYPDYPDLKDRDEWKDLTPRIILNHTTGFANFRWLSDDGKLQFYHKPGERYGYSGEGFYILQLALEEGLGLDVGREMQERIFDRFGMTNTSMIWRPDFKNNLADGYKHDGSFEPHDDRSSVSAAGSMDTTPEDQAKMWAGMMRGEGLSEASRQEWVRPQHDIKSKSQFPSLQTEMGETNDAIHLSAGLGLVTFRENDGLGWFKGGHNDWTGNFVVCFEDEKRCVVLMANDVRAENYFPQIAAQILGDVYVPWHWEYSWYQSGN